MKYNKNPEFIEMIICSGFLFSCKNKKYYNIIMFTTKHYNVIIFLINK